MSDKRIPGQSDADYARSASPTREPNGPYTYLGALEGGADDSGLARLVSRLIDAVLHRVRRR